MTDSEVPDSRGPLLGGPTDSDSVPAVHSVAPEFPTRRSLRRGAATPPIPQAPAEAAARPAPVLPDAVAPDVVGGEGTGTRSGTRRAARKSRRDATSRAARGAQPARAPRPAARPAANRTSIRARFSAAGTMLMIGGLFASFGLPAFAEGADPEVVATVSSPRDNQTFAVSEDAAAAAVVRDEYNATSAAALRRLYRDQVRQANLERYLASGAVAQGDDYPWPGELTTGQGGGLSPLRYYYRECVDFVAWRLNRDVGSTRAPFVLDWSYMTPGGGSAISWKYQWDSKGWTTSATPQVGWVAWFGGLNHVAYVSEVNGSSITVEEYNWGNDHAYNRRTISASSVTAFLSPPPLP